MSIICTSIAHERRHCSPRQPFLLCSVGDLRLRLPKPVVSYTGAIDATVFGNQCIQQTSPPPSLPSNVPSAAVGYLPALDSVPDLPQSEDCAFYHPRTGMFVVDVCFRPQPQPHRSRECDRLLKASSRSGKQRRSSSILYDANPFPLPLVVDIWRLAFTSRHRRSLLH